MSEATAFKVVGRWAFHPNPPVWRRAGKMGTQFKKTIYTSQKDFDNYSPEILERWLEICGSVETYEMFDGKWVQVEVLCQ